MSFLGADREVAAPLAGPNVGMRHAGIRNDDSQAQPHERGSPGCALTALSQFGKESKMKFRKRPVEVEAVQVKPSWFDGDHPNPDLPADSRLVYSVKHRTVEVHTLEGVMTAHEGDWLITGVKGEIYPCKPDIFEATYEPVV